MKVVDVLSTKVYGDGQQIIAQVSSSGWSIVILILILMHMVWPQTTAFITRFCCGLQGDLANCFYIIESGQVKITMKRSRVSWLTGFLSILFIAVVFLFDMVITFAQYYLKY